MSKIKKIVLTAAFAGTALAAAATQGKFEIAELDGFRLHVYTTNDALGDASFIIEGADALVTLEEPLFKTNAAEFDAYLAALGKPVAKRIADYHLGNTGTAPVVMAQGMPAFTRGPVYGGMMKNFAAAFGDAIVALPTGTAEEAAFGAEHTWAGVTFAFRRGAASDFPAASILIGGQVYFTHWVPAKAHVSSLQVGSRAAVDAEIAEAQASLASGAAVFVGAHGGAADAEAAEFKIAYLQTVKRLLAENATADAFAAALTAAFPSLPGAEGVPALAEALYK